MKNPNTGAAVEYAVDYDSYMGSRYELRDSINFETLEFGGLTFAQATEFIKELREQAIENQQDCIEQLASIDLADVESVKRIRWHIVGSWWLIAHYDSELECIADMEYECSR